jgi:hypothetical protein
MSNKDLKEKLLIKKQDLKDKRTSSLVIKKRQEKIIINKDNEDEYIFNTTQQLMNDLRKLVLNGERNIPKIDKKLKVKYAWLRDNKFAIYKAVLTEGGIDLELLRMMLMEKRKIDNKEIDAKEASLRMGAKLAEKYHVDVDALVKSAEKNKAKLDKEKNNL